MDQLPPAEPIQHIGLPELQGRLEDVLLQTARGASFLVTSGDQVLAELRPPPPPAVKPERKPGGMEGRIWMADDFDTWPDDILNAMEGRHE